MELTFKNKILSLQILKHILTAIFLNDAYLELNDRFKKNTKNEKYLCRIFPGTVL